jgi:hypothetical protein
MTRLRLHLVLPLLTLLLSGCQIFLDATLFNNTDEDVEIDAGKDIVAVAPNQFAHLTYPNESTDRVFRLAIGKCVYLYEVPEALKDYHLPDFQFRTGRGVQIQVEKDFSVNLLSPSYAGDTPASGEMILQREGFPLHPIDRKCGQRQG